MSHATTWQSLVLSMACVALGAWGCATDEVEAGSPAGAVVADVLHAPDPGVDGLAPADAVVAPEDAMAGRGDVPIADGLSPDLAPDTPDTPSPRDVARLSDSGPDVGPPPCPDLDGDGFASATCGGGDCDDAKAGVHPGAADPVGGSCTAASQWATSGLADDVGAFASMTVDASDTAHVAYEQGQSGLIYGVDTADGLDWASVDDGPDVGSNVDVLVDAAGVVHISYLDLSVGGRLKYASNAPGFFGVAVVEQGFVGWFSELARSPDAVHIAYQDVDKGDLRYARCETPGPESQCWQGGWTTESPVSAGDTGKFSSLALTAAGEPRISYHDVTNGRLEVAGKVDDVWSTQVVDPGPAAGWCTSIGLDPASRAHVSYFAPEAGELRYASNVGGTWGFGAVATVAMPNYSGQQTSIVVDALGGVAIAFTDQSQHGLRLARCRLHCGPSCCPGEWEVVTLDAYKAPGGNVSLARGPSDALRVGYAFGQPGQAALRYAVAPCADSWLDQDCDGVDGAAP